MVGILAGMCWLCGQVGLVADIFWSLCSRICVGPGKRVDVRQGVVRLIVVGVGALVGRCAVGIRVVLGI